ncbi:TRAP transporter substrate-binding protein DctP [Nitratireductor basaltis]|uniref:TRAP dicarboxylate transporter subunit DctP n=1 Tax=Nitratireductor basaltis TaxID=472175 RepID=A0A084UDW7_9HYPH|nr:TRAP transporter substrate-binding protein DctP [Nitratireductor basaltis]KFB11153.1 TRAP dicarboxylate transporter subunit DctP [Nitratireductor basaltis]
MKFLKHALAASALALGLASGASAQEEPEFKLVTPLATGEDNYNYQAMQAFRNHVFNKSNGRVDIEIYTGGTLCASGRECFEGMQAGLVDIYQSNFGEPGNLWPAFAGLDLPYMLRDDQVAECVFDDEEFMATLRQGMMEQTGNIRLMVISNSGGWRNFATTNKPILKPEDVKGMKLRTIPAEIQQELVRQLGGAPTGISWPEVYTSLATGVVEGTKNGITDIVTMNFHEHLKHITLDGHAYMGGTWFINNDKFMAMDEDLRKIVFEGFEVIEQYLRSYPKYHDVKSFKAFTDAGGTIHSLTNEEKAAFREAASGMEEWFTSQDPANQEFLDSYKAAISQCEAAVDEKLQAVVQ